MKATLLGFTVPDDLVAEINRTDAFMATQTHRFAWGVVRGLREAGVQVDLLSAAPVSDYPRNPRRAFGGGRFTQHGVDGSYLPFINLLVLKHVTRWLSAWFLGGRHLRRARPSWLLVHGVHSPFLWYAVYARRRLGLSVCVFMTDPPGVVLPSDSGLRRLLKTIDIGVTKRALARVDAVVALAEPLAIDYAPGVPFMTMEGVFDPTSWPVRDRAASGDQSAFTITYAGGLSEEYGVGRLVRAARACPDEDIRLQLLGRGDLEGWIREQAEEDPRVLPPRLVDPADLSDIYAQSDVLVQPRPVAQGFVRYSFPSKLLEYMASGTPVVSTRLSSIPEAYEGLLLWADDSEGGMMQALRHVRELPTDERAAIARRASEFVRTTRSGGAQGHRMRAFLDGCVAVKD